MKLLLCFALHLCLAFLFLSAMVHSLDYPGVYGLACLFVALHNVCDALTDIHSRREHARRMNR